MDYKFFTNIYSPIEDHEANMLSKREYVSGRKT
jgi:hypothetical protein